MKFIEIESCVPNCKEKIVRLGQMIKRRESNKRVILLRDVEPQ